MGLRRKAREQALQVLYAGEMNGSPAGENLADFGANFSLAPGSEEFTRRLVFGVEEHRERIDGSLAILVKNWKLERITQVDRVILRIAAYEILFEPDIPPAVSINEAIEIAKRFSTAQSGKFINGILDRLQLEGTREEN